MGLAGLMTTAQTVEDPVITATLMNQEAREAGKQLAFIMAMMFRAPVLGQVVKAGPGDWLTVWCSLCVCIEPLFKTRFAGVDDESVRDPECKWNHRVMTVGVGSVRRLVCYLRVSLKETHCSRIV